MTVTVCPKCTYERQPVETAPPWQCPRCSVAYAKVAGGSPLAPRGAAVPPRKARLPANPEFVAFIDPPGLSTINGCGFKLYGRGKVDPRDGSFLATYYFVLGFIPVLPLARYRVIREGDTYSFLGRVRLTAVDRLHLGLVLAMVAALFVANLRR